MSKDFLILRELGLKLAEIAALPVQAEKKNMWRALNDLKPVRPMVYLDQLPWHELNENNELTLICEDDFLRSVELEIRKILYRWNHFPADMVVENRIDIPKTVHGLLYGADIDEETLSIDSKNDIVSHKYVDQCSTLEELDQIKLDKIWVDEDLDKRHLEICQEIFDGIMPVRLSGICIHGGVWDRISQMRPAENILIDLIDRPEFTRQVVEKFRDLTMSAIDQCEALGLLDAEAPLIHCTGAYVSDLPAEGYNPSQARAKDCWAFSMAQIFSTVGPDIHEEFEIDLLKPLLERFGLIYYGCCEPLDRKVSIIKKIKNVRKISMSPWVNMDAGAEAIGRNYVYSGKAHPTFIAGTFDEESIRKQAVHILDACKRNDTPCEIILKDVSTVGYKPQILEQWERLVMSLVTS